MTTNQQADDDSLADYWRDVKAAQQAKRASNRANSADLLVQAGIGFEFKNGGAHLILRAHDGPMVDFWPGTGRWQVRGEPRPKFGVHKLIARVLPQTVAKR